MFIQLPLKTGEHLDELVIGEEPSLVRVAPVPGAVGGEDKSLSRVFDKDVGMWRMIVGGASAPDGCQFSLRRG